MLKLSIVMSLWKRFAGFQKGKVETMFNFIQRSELTSTVIAFLSVEESIVTKLVSFSPSRVHNVFSSNLDICLTFRILTAKFVHFSVPGPDFR